MFLPMPYPTIKTSVRCLDTITLKQTLKDAVVLLRALRRGKAGWATHPVCRSWSGYEDALIRYGNAVVRECILRGIKTTIELEPEKPSFEGPWWFTSPAHQHHHRALLMKARPSFYAKKGWSSTKLYAEYYPRGKRHKGQFVIVERGSTVL